MTIPCPCCGRPWQTPKEFVVYENCLVWRSRLVWLTKMEFEIFSLLWGRLGRIVSLEAIFAHLYRDRPDGGPENHRIGQMYLSKIKKKLREAGAPLRFRTVHGSGVIMLLTICQENIP